MTSPRAVGAAAAVTVVTVLAAAGCSDESKEAIEDDLRTVATEVTEAADDVSEDVVELAARNVASVQGSQEFEAVGQPIADGLTCQADAAADLTAVEISCTGTTEDGADAELRGETSELPGASFDELRGTFVGTVDGVEVFSVERLGD